MTGRYRRPAAPAQVYGETRQYTLRATHVWRREDGEWKIVHRHGDVPPADNFSSPDR
jgi:ketosteroid isomerase-like protein